MNFASLPHALAQAKSRMARGISLEMNWLPLQARKGCPLGLKNLGNSCYLNSVLQCLTYTPPLANFCLRNRHSSSCTFSSDADSSTCLFCVVEKRIARSLSIDTVSESPARIHSCLSLFAKHFREGWQEDAHEFLRYVIEACNNVCVKLHKMLYASKLRTRQDSQKLLKEEPHTVVKEIFGGILQSQVKCLTCKAESNKLDEMMDLSLDIFKLASLKDALCRYFQPEVLDGSNKYKCEKCKKLTAARKQMSVSQAPNVLVIQFKRFENFCGGKIDRHVSFEEDLELHSHMCRDSQDQRPEYGLYGVIVHAGYSQDSGHYYSYVKDSHGKWFCCNDAHVTSATSKSVLSEKAYVLFYVRKAIKSAVNSAAVLENGFTTGTVKENGKVAVIRNQLVVNENGLSGKSSCCLEEQALKENGVTETSSIRPKEQVVKVNLDTEKSNISPKELKLTDNCVTQKANISLGNVQQVRFKIAKSGSNGEPQKLSGNALKQIRNVFNDTAPSKGQLSCDPVTLDANKANSMKTMVKPAAFTKQEFEGRIPCTTNVELQHSDSSNESNALSLVEGNRFCSGAVPSGDEGRIKGLSNGSHFGSCSLEKAPNSSIDGPKSRPASVQKQVTPSLSSECKREEKSDGALSNVGVTGKLFDQPSLPSQDVTIAPRINPDALCVPLKGSDLEARLVAESREWLLQSGWCDCVRNSFRQLKRARLSQSSKGSEDKLKMPSEVFASVHDLLRQKVPKELKEHLVNHLQEYVAIHKLKNL